MASGTAEAHEKNLVGKLFFNEPVNGFKIYGQGENVFWPFIYRCCAKNTPESVSSVFLMLRARGISIFSGKWYTNTDASSTHSHNKKILFLDTGQNDKNQYPLTTLGSIVS